MPLLFTNTKDRFLASRPKLLYNRLVLSTQHEGLNGEMGDAGWGNGSTMKP